MTSHGAAADSLPGAESYTVRPLDPSTWDSFAELVERNGGVFGGCWCMGHHQRPEGGSYQQVGGIDKRATKEALVRSGQAHAAVVFDESGLAQGWAKYGRIEELPILTRAVLGGAVELIQRAGGGTVEAIPEVTRDRLAHGRFLFQASVELFEDHGFERVRQLGKWAWLVRRQIAAEGQTREETA